MFASLKKILPNKLKYFFKQIYLCAERKIVSSGFAARMPVLDCRCYDGKKVLVLIPHPDDEILGSGGLLISLCDAAEVTVVYFTQGEKGLSFISPDILIKKRAALRKRVLENLNVSGVFELKLPDGGIPFVDTSAGQNVLHELNRILSARKFDLVVFPHEIELLKDHQAVASYAKRLLADHVAEEGLGFYVWSWLQSVRQIKSNSSNVVLALTPSILSAKKKLIDIYFGDKTENGIPYSGYFPMGMFSFLHNMKIEVYDRIQKRTTNEHE